MTGKFEPASSLPLVASELCADASSAESSEASGAASSGATGFPKAESSRTAEGFHAAAGSSTASSPKKHPDDLIPAPVSAWQILLIFLRLGYTSFGGPVAHLAFFQTEFVDKRRWLSASAYAELVALCQFLPGPASSQVGMALGWQQAGWRGALAAWFGFTMPSALLLIAAALGLVQGAWLNNGAELGLLLVTMAVVAQALWSMQRSLLPGWRERAIAVLVAVCLLFAGSGLALQLLIMALVVVLGGWWLQAGRVAPEPDDEADRSANPPTATASRLTRSSVTSSSVTPKRVMLGCLGLLGALLLLTPWLVQQWPDSLLWQLTDKLLRAGSLVFGGGHVVLPWLHSEFVGSGMVSEQLLASGYGITQAMPGPLFSVAALLGAASSLAVSPSPLLAIGYGLWALLVMFLPAWLLVLAAMPYWQQLRRHGRLQSMLQAVNAAVVGLLLVAWLSLWPLALALTAPFAEPPALMIACLASIVLGAAWLLQRRLLPVWLLVLGFTLAFSLGFAQI